MERFLFFGDTTQRTASDIVIAIAGRIVVDVGKTAVVAITAVEPIGILKNCPKPSLFTKNLIA